MLTTDGTEDTDKIRKKEGLRGVIFLCLILNDRSVIFKEEKIQDSGWRWFWVVGYRLEGKGYRMRQKSEVRRQTTDGWA